MLDRDLGHRAFSPEQQRYHQDFAILLQGQSSRKDVEGQTYQTIPSLLLDAQSRNFFLGVFLPEQNTFYNALWGGYPEIIRGWRALRVLENLPLVDNRILHAAWDVAGSNSTDTSYHMDTIAPLFGGLEQLNAFRERLMETGPSPEQLQDMITKSQQAGLQIEGWELKREVDAGILTPTPLIEEIIRDAQARSKAAREKQDRQEAELKVPLPEEESLGKLFQQLEIGNIIVGLPIGGFGLDWGFTPVEEVDKDLRFSSYYGSNGQSLYRSTAVPTFDRDETTPGITMVTPSFGKIEQPSWTDDKTQTKVTFQEARFSDGHIYLTILVEKPAGEIEEAEYTIPDFRKNFAIPMVNLQPQN